MINIEIVGLKEYKYIRENKDVRFRRFKNISTKHLIYGKVAVTTRWGEKLLKNVEILLEIVDEMCQYGFCIASFGIVSIKFVEYFDYFTHVPKKPMDITLPLKIRFNHAIYFHTDPKYNYMNNEAFEFSSLGTDKFIPSGFYKINYQAFEKTEYYKENRIVFILKGSNEIDTAIFSKKLNNMIIYKTSSATQLPEEIFEDVILISDESIFTIDDVKSKIYGEAEIIICNIESLGIINKLKGYDCDKFFSVFKSLTQSILGTDNENRVPTNNNFHRNTESSVLKYAQNNPLAERVNTCQYAKRMKCSFCMMDYFIISKYLGRKPLCRRHRNRIYANRISHTNAKKF